MGTGLRFLAAALIVFSAGPAYASCRNAVNAELVNQGVPRIQRVVVRPRVLSTIRDLNTEKITRVEARAAVGKFIAGYIHHAGTRHRLTNQTMAAIDRLRQGACSRY